MNPVELPPERDLPCDRLLQMKDHVVDEIRRTGPASTRRRMSRKRLVPVVAVGLVTFSAVGVLAAGGYLGEAIPGSPWITTEEAADRVPELAEGIPHPEGRTFAGRAELYHEMSAQDIADTGQLGNVQVAGIRETLARDATCMWMDEWLTAHQRGDSATATQAQLVLDEVAGWPYWSLNNEQMYTELATELADAARQENADVIVRELGLNCAPYTTLVPEINPTG